MRIIKPANIWDLLNVEKFLSQLRRLACR